MTAFLTSRLCVGQKKRRRLLEANGFQERLRQRWRDGARVLVISADPGAFQRNDGVAEELRRADSVQREYRFSILVPASDYFPQAAEGEELLLQGVVDLFARTAEGILVVDFKTDYVTEETLAEKAAYYRPQLTAYSAALERILGEPVVRRALYFFRTGDTVEV